MSGSRVPAMLGWLLFFGGIAAAGYFMFGRGDGANTDEAFEEKFAALLADSERYLRQQRYDAMLETVNEALEIKADDPRALILAGRGSAMVQDYAGSIGYYSRVPIDDSQNSIDARYEKARIEYEYRTYSNAEKDLRSVLERDPDHLEANRLMGEIMDLSGRRWEAIPYALEVARQTQARLDTLLRLADQEQMEGRLAKILKANERDRSDPAPRLGLCRTALWEGQPDASRMLAESVIKDRPDLVEAHVRLGGLLLDSAPDEFVQWHEALPEGVDFHPDLWVFRGRWARMQNQTKAAARCFWEAVKRNPNEGPGAKALGQLLIQLGREEDAQPFLDRAASLSELRSLIGMATKARQQAPVEIIKQIPEQLTKLGRSREAAGWNALLSGKRAAPDGARHAKTPEDVLTLWVSKESQPGLTIDLSDLPLPDFSKAANTKNGLDSTSLKFKARYEDLAASVGLDFTFVGAPDETTEGKRIIELTGGGVGAIDFDLDSWPDMFLTQGGLYPAVPENGHRDKLYRNMGDRFEDVTALVGIDGPEFGQGMSVADFNADGFPDLYVGNNDKNKLYVNNGDGTMTDVSESLNDTHADWTTSVVMADANGDSLPDIYVVNYVKGKIYELICEIDGTPRICGPEAFEGVQDRFFLNMGDGTFADKTQESGVVRKTVKEQGKGLGILVADFEETGALQFFVANDGVPNFLFSKPQSDEPFQDLSRRSGIATSGDGVPQGCMGIAAADADGDGLLDFFVTNFDGEFNTLYLNQAGLFEDRTRQAKLHDASYRFVGFGTQFVDGELDGSPDLLVTNGHVADFVSGLKPAPEAPQPQEKQRRAAVVTYRMPCQYFRNDSWGTFNELFSEDVGEFFDKEFLGRGMAKMDWNKDGREDVGISYLDTPVSLLTNTSKETGHYIAIKLVGTTTNRDAIGTTVRLQDGDWRRMQQLTGGDGYQCSNEKRLVFGLGDRTTIPKLEIKWLDGSKQTFENVSADQEVVIVQGEAELRAMTK